MHVNDLDEDTECMFIKSVDGKRLGERMTILGNRIRISKHLYS